MHCGNVVVKYRTVCWWRVRILPHH